MSRAIIEHSRQVWLATDHSKFNRPAMVELARLSQLDRLFTDVAPPAPYPALLAEAGVRCDGARGLNDRGLLLRICRGAAAAFLRWLLRGFSEARQAVPGRGSCWGGRRVRRLRCGARSEVASPNSLRSLRSAALKQRRRVSLRSALRAPTTALCSSPPQKSPRPGTACRAAYGFGFATESKSTLAQRRRVGFSDKHPQTFPQRRVRVGRSAPLRRRRSGRLVAPFAARSSTDSAPLFERS